MGLRQGLYKVSTMSRNGPMFVALPPGPPCPPGHPIMGGPEGWMTVLSVESAGGNRYCLRLWYVTGMSVGYDQNNVVPGARTMVLPSSDQAWAVDPGNSEDCYRVHVPDANMYWSIAPSARDPTPITLQPLQGMPTQEWKFELLRG